jgi:DNA polymerase-3 subunit beta
MKLTVPRAALLAALAHCVAVVAGKATNFAANAVLIHAAERLVLQATDAVSTSLRVRVEGAEVATAGSVAVSARDLLERVKAMPDGATVLLELKAELLIVRAAKGDRKFTLRTLTAADLPAFPVRDPSGVALRLPGVMLSTAIGAVSYAMSEDPSRANMHAVLVSVRDGQLCADAASSGRIALFDVDIDAPGNLQALLAPRAAALLERLGSSAPDVTLEPRGTRLFASAGGIEVALSVISAEPPPSRSVAGMVVPSARAEVDRKALLEAVRSASLAATSKGRRVNLRVDGAELFLEATSASGEEALDSVPLASPCEASVGAAFPATHLAEALAAAVADTVTLGLASTALTIQCSDAEGARTIAVIAHLTGEASA